MEGSDREVELKEGLEEILRRSSHLMARRGYHGTSMRDLARETQYSLSGLYNYFKDKEELLYLINYRGFSAIIKSLESLLEEFKSPIEQLYLLIYNHLHYFMRHRDEMKVMMMGTHEMDPQRSRTIRAIKNRYFHLGEKIVDELYLTSTGKKLLKRELTRKCYLLFGMVNWTFTWYDQRVHGEPSELIGEIFCTAVTGFFGAQPLAISAESIQRIADEWGKRNLDRESHL